MIVNKACLHSRIRGRVWIRKCLYINIGETWRLVKKSTCWDCFQAAHQSPGSAGRGQLHVLRQTDVEQQPRRVEQDGLLVR